MIESRRGGGHGLVTVFIVAVFQRYLVDAERGGRVDVRSLYHPLGRLVEREGVLELGKL